MKMRTRNARFAGLLAAAAALTMPMSAQSYSSMPVTIGPAPYALNFTVTWTCDDHPLGTASAAGRVDLVDGTGNTVGEITATASPAGPAASVSGTGTASNLSAVVNLYGSAGTPADGHLRGTWTLSGLAAGTYTLRFWTAVTSQPGRSATEITTYTLFAGDSSLGPSPTPPPAASPAPSITLTAPAAATVRQLFSVEASATRSAGGSPLASVTIDASLNNGVTWARLLTDSRPGSPLDREALDTSFGATGVGILRATVTDAEGKTSVSSQPVAVGKASQPAVSITPAAAVVTAGLSVAFTAAGGATGAYSWSGFGGGTGPAQTRVFPTAGTYTVTVMDVGDGTYNPSAPATALITVQPPFNVLSTAATGSGSVTGGGSYAPTAQAEAVATAATGSAFTGWTGDAAGTAATVFVSMTTNKSVTAHFSPLLAQAITFPPPGPVSTRTAALTLVATASSGLPVSLTLSSGPGTLAGEVLTLAGVVGQITVTATQPGNRVYLPAPPVVVTFPVGPPPPGVWLADDSAATKRTDRMTRNTSFTSGSAR